MPSTTSEEKPFLPIDRISLVPFRMRRTRVNFTRRGPRAILPDAIGLLESEKNNRRGIHSHEKDRQPRNIHT